MLSSLLKFASVGALSLLAFAPIENASAFEPDNTECIAPANAGGGWDFTCRQVGKVLQDLKLVNGNMLVVNMAGGGGGVAFAEVINKRNGDDNLIVAASSATTTRLAQGAFPGNTMDQVRWVAGIGADYGGIAVAADSPYNSLSELMAAVKNDPTSVSFGGGSAVGGWDHLKVLLAAMKVGITDVRTIKYVAFDGGGEAVTQLLGGSIQAFTGDMSEMKGFVEAGSVKVLAVLAPERLGGDFAKHPTAKEQGIDVVGANWRGFYAPGGMSDDAYNFWVDKISTLYASAEWKQIMTDSGLADFGLKGSEFEAFVKNNIAEIQALSKEIGILK